MLMAAAVLGGVSALGFGLTYWRLPHKARDFITRHPLVTDAAATALTYKVLGGTLTALTAAGFMSVGISSLLVIPAAKRKLAQRRAMKQMLKQAAAIHAAKAKVDSYDAANH